MESRFNIWWAKRFMTARVKAAILRDIATLSASSNALEVVQDMARIYSNQGKNNGRAIPVAMRQVASRMHAGEPFSKALSDFLPATERQIIAAVEEGGVTVVDHATNIQVDPFPDSLRQVATIMEVMDSINTTAKQSIRSMLYNLFLLMGDQLIFSTLILPKFEEARPDTATWSLISTIFIAFCHIILWLVPISVISVLVVTIFANATKHTLTGKFRTRVDGIWPWAVFKNEAVAYFTLAMAAMTRSGKTDVQSMEILERDSTPYMKERYSTFLAFAPTYGTSMAIRYSGLDFLPEDSISLLQIHEERTGDFAHAIQIIGNEFIKTGADEFKARISGVQNIILGITVLYTVIMMFGSAYIQIDLQDIIKKLIDSMTSFR